MLTSLEKNIETLTAKTEILKEQLPITNYKDHYLFQIVDILEQMSNEINDLKFDIEVLKNKGNLNGNHN